MRVWDRIAPWPCHSPTPSPSALTTASSAPVPAPTDLYLAVVLIAVGRLACIRVRLLAYFRVRLGCLGDLAGLVLPALALVGNATPCCGRHAPNPDPHPILPPLAGCHTPLPRSPLTLLIHTCSTPPHHSCPSPPHLSCQQDVFACLRHGSVSG